MRTRILFILAQVVFLWSVTASQPDQESTYVLNSAVDWMSSIWYTATSFLDCNGTDGGDDTDGGPAPNSPAPVSPAPTIATTSSAPTTPSPVISPTNPAPTTATSAPQATTTPSPVASPTNPSPTSSSSPTGFTISLELDGVTDDFEFQNAISTWGTIITEELPDYSGALPGSSYCGPWPDFVDDLHMCGQYQFIDGEGGVLGAAGPRHYRSGSNLPITGQMKFDSADVDRPGINLLGIILHEMGHVLGIGPMWKVNGLTDSYTPPCPYKADSAASREYQSLSGCSSKAIPIEQSFDGTGSNCGHWQEGCLGREIMTPSADATLPISRVTIAGLQDLGYTVNYGIAESYQTKELDGNCRCDDRRSLRTNNPLEDVLLLNDNNPNNDTPRKQYRQLSEEGKQIAVDFGKGLLAENRASNSLIPGDGDVPDMGGEIIYVMYEEADGGIHSVMVREES